MFENVQLQDILIVSGAVLLGGLGLFVIYIGLRQAWNNKTAAGLVLAGLVPGLVLGIFFGQTRTPASPTDQPAQSSTEETGANKVVIALDPVEPAVDLTQTQPEPELESDLEVVPSDEAGLESSDPPSEDMVASDPEILDEEEDLDPVPSDDVVADTTEEPLVEQESPQTATEDLDPNLSTEIDLLEASDETQAEEDLEALRDPPVAFMPRRNPADSNDSADTPNVTSTDLTPIQPSDDPADPRLQEASDYIDLANLFLEDHPGGSVNYFKKALAIYEDMEAYDLVGRTLLDIGYANLLKKDLAEAQKYNLAALKVSQDIDDDFVKVRALINLGFVHMNKRDPENALIYYGQALEIAKDSGSSRSLATLLENIGYAYAAKEDKEQTLEYLDRALEVATEIGAQDLVDRISVNLENYQ